MHCHCCLPLCFSFMAPFSFHVPWPTIQTRTSPSPPPLMICWGLDELVVATAVTPIWCALSIAYNNLPVSGVNARILPSSQPIKRENRSHPFRMIAFLSYSQPNRQGDVTLVIKNCSPELSLRFNKADSTRKIDSH